MHPLSAARAQRRIRSIAVALVIACGLAACTGDGDETADAPPEGPPTDTPAPPPGPPGSGTPTADAGEDRTTVEEQDVSVDGSGSRDPDGDPLAYAWQLGSVPEGSGVSVQADTPTFVFRPDVPGTYELQLTVSDGRSSSSDTMRVRADPLIEVDDRVRFEADLRKGRGRDDDEERRGLDVETSRLYRGDPVSFTVGVDVPWVRVVSASGTTAPPGDDTSVVLELVMDEVEELQKGEHEGRVTVTPAGGWERAVSLVTLKVERRDMDSLVPNVGYTGEPASVVVHGDGLLTAAGATVFVDDLPMARLETVTNERAAVHLPGLQAGAHAIRIGHGALADETLRFVVRDPPVHRPTQLSVPGPARSLDYSAELDAFYAVFVRPDGARVAQRLQNSGTGEWVRAPIPVPAPWALALTADGSQLIVSAEGCTVHRLEPRTLSLMESYAKASCAPEVERFGAIATLADGRVLAVDDLGDSSGWTWPLLTPMQVLPRIDDPPVLNADRQRLAWSASVLRVIPDAASERSFVAPYGTAIFDFTSDAFIVREMPRTTATIPRPFVADGR